MDIDKRISHQIFALEAAVKRRQLGVELGSRELLDGLLLHAREDKDFFLDSIRPRKSQRQSLILA
jgi:hypothetical protein